MRGRRGIVRKVSARGSDFVGLGSVPSRVVFERAQIRASGLLPVGGGHDVYWEESGNLDGIPALYLHGGPGATLGSGGYRGKFDPERFRIVGLDQRGCGRSTPHVTAAGYDLAENTTAHLISDIEQVRRHLQIDAWLINGVSWGSTLALAYAQAHRQHVLGIVLMAVTTTDRFYVDWITETVGAIYPEAWDRLAAHAEHAGIGYHRGRGRLIDAYAQLMTHPEAATRDAASRAWVEWEDHHISIGARGLHRNAAWDDDEYRQVFAILVTHYWANDAFLRPPILDQTERLSGIPGTLIHGRLDVSGPALAAWRLHQAWPGSELIVEENEGHGGEAMVNAWALANSRHADTLDQTRTGL